MQLRLLNIFILLLFSQYSWAKISVSIDREPVVANESFQLIFESDEKVDVEPDFSALKNSFTVLNKSQRSSTRITNGKIEQSQQWALTVLANRAGTLEVPSIKIGNTQSQVYKLEVLEAPTATQSGPDDDIFIELDVDTLTPYVQAQVVYTVRLFRAIQTNNATLSEPNINTGQAIINKLGDDRSFEIRRHGKRYVVIERRYVFFPQSSGPLKIDPLVFQGQTGAGSFFNFDPFGPQPKSIIKRSEAIQFEVKPIPDSFTGDNWLPAANLNIQEQWSIDPSNLKQGEATTRTLALQAQGLVASQLPAINSALPDNLKTYPDQPEFEETNDENGFIGMRRDKMAIIPTEPGDYILPVIQVPWWNTKTDKMEIAELPERVIQAQAVVAIDGTDPALTINTIPAIDESTELNPLMTTDKPTEVVEPYWKWLSFVLLVLWLLTLFIWWRSQDGKPQVQKDMVENPTKRVHLNAFKQACVSNNASLAKDNLLLWAKANWQEDEINNLDAIKKYCDDDFQNKLIQLNQYLYGESRTDWEGKIFLQSFSSQSFKTKPVSVENNKLEPLYKL